MTQVTYDSSFMEVTAQSRRSAERIVSRVREVLPVLSVADFGCALGTWLSIWKANGIEDVLGLDGDYLRGQRLEIDPARILFRDLTKPIDLERRFDLVQSLEVAEHLPREAATTFVETLTRHGDLILFSAAPPGQGGEHHLNERDYAYWRELFRRQGFCMSDWIRPLIIDDLAVRYWYRYNTFMFIRESRLDTVPTSIQSAVVRATEPVRDISPSLFKLRKQIVRRLPQRWQTEIAKALSRLRSVGTPKSDTR